MSNNFTTYIFLFQTFLVQIETSISGNPQLALCILKRMADQQYGGPFGGPNQRDLMNMRYQVCSSFSFYLKSVEQ